MSQLELTVVMPYIPQTSVNACYGQSRWGGKYLKPEAHWWKNIFRQRLGNQLERGQLKNITPDVKIRLSAFFPLQKGQKPDAENFLKLASDATAEELGFHSDHTFITGVEQVSHSKDNGRGILVYEIKIPLKLKG